ncbi:MAG: hypothetical protein M3072_17750 [Candidatus Dormibacteraeota bacterium]|nr:hypothetical protein [Candidatus Dormibacteraeota bacterium]
MDSRAALLTSSIRRRVAVPSAITMAGIDQGEHAYRDLGLLRHLFQGPAQGRAATPELLC